MKKFFILLLIFSFSIISPAYADTPSDLEKQLQDKQAEIQKLEEQLASTRNQEKTLKSQLNLVDGQTKVTTLKIEETTLKIEKLKREINDLSSRIERIGNTLNYLSEVLLRRIVETYKYSNTLSAFELLFSSHGFADLIERVKYLQVAQTYDKKKLYELQATKLAYSDQKEDKQTRQTEAEKLNKELEVYKAQLEKQKRDKEELLRITKNDEARFQSLIAQLKADTDSIRKALGNIGVKIGPVKRGDIIAVIGNTGCSSGPHLHFEVMNNARVENNAVIGKENKVDPKPLIDSGQMEKPITSYSGTVCQSSPCSIGSISTLFGEWYAVGRHEGLDLVDYSGTPIKAAADGIAYAVSAPIGNWCPPSYRASSLGNGVIIDHQNGYVTLYWHIP